MVNFTTFRGKENYTIPQAHIVKENPFQAVASTVQTHAQNAANLKKALLKGEGTDYTLGRMNDTTIRMGSLGIATLASAKALSSVSGIGEFIGFACWFAAMGISPKIINKMIQAKYGLNLDKEYVDSYGRRKKLFEDPGFICWDLIPNAELDKIGDKMGVPKNIVNRREAIQEKITQVNIQSKTWMMITAGVGTPVIASLVADQLKKPFNGLLNTMHARNMGSLQANVESALAGGNVEKARKLLASAVDSTFGMKEGSAIARMWQATPEQVAQKTGLMSGATSKLGEIFQKAKKVISGEAAWIPRVAGKAPIASEGQKISAIAQYLTQNGAATKDGIQALETSIATTKGWGQQILDLIAKHPELKDGALEEFVKLRVTNLESGFGNMKNVLEQAANGASSDTLSKLLRGVTDAAARRQIIEKVKPEVVVEYLGRNSRNEALVNEVKTLLEAGKTEKAIDLLSKRPFKFVDDAMTNSLLHKRWLKRIGLVGIGLIAATAIYTFFFLGNSNKYNPAIKADGKQ